MYTTTQAASGQAKVIAVARDLPGNIGQGVEDAALDRLVYELYGLTEEEIE